MLTYIYSHRKACNHFVFARVRKLLIGQKVQKLQNRAICNRALIGKGDVSIATAIATMHFASLLYKHHICECVFASVITDG